MEQLHHAERLSTIGKLASGIAHELGTPLNVVSGRAQMILSGEVTESDDVTKIARIVVDQVERMTRIVRQLLDFSRRRSAEKRPIDVAYLARQTAALLEPIAARHRVSLLCVGSPEALTVAADPGQLQQARAADRPGRQMRLFDHLGGRAVRHRAADGPGRARCCAG